MKSIIKDKRKIGMPWYIKLNIMVMGFLFVLFFMKELNTSSFRAGLENIFSSKSSQSERSARIQLIPKKEEKETIR